MKPGAGGVLVVAQAAPDLSTAYARVGREVAVQLSNYRPVHLIGCHGNVASEFTLAEDELRVPVHPYPWSYFDPGHMNQLAKTINAELCLYIGDAWPFARKLVMAAQEMPWIIHAPIDHVPLIGAEKVLAENVAKWAAPTKWAADEIPGSKGVYVQHGVSTALTDSAAAVGTREDACKRLGWDPNVTRFLSVGGNVGDRKNLAGLIRAWKDAELKDSELVLWCYPTRDDSNPDGMDLIGAATEMGITNIRFPDPYTVSVGYSDYDLGIVYKACDALMQVSKTEGFGIPIAEAQAIGIPAIVPRYAPFLEVAGVRDINDPLTIELGAWELMQLLGTAWMPTPYHKSIVQVLRHFKNHGIEPEEMKRRQSHSDRYQWSIAAVKLNKVIAAILATKDLEIINEPIVAALE